MKVEIKLSIECITTWRHLAAIQPNQFLAKEPMKGKTY